MPPAARTTPDASTSTAGVSCASPASTPPATGRARPRPRSAPWRPARRRRTRRPSLFSRSHSPATTASWCSPSTSWSSVIALAKSRTSLPSAGATASAAYRQRFAAIRARWSSWSAESGPSACIARRSLRHGFRTKSESSSVVGELVVEVIDEEIVDRVGELRRTRRVDELVEQREVAVGPHVAQQLDAVVLASLARACGAAACRRRCRTAAAPRGDLRVGLATPRCRARRRGFAPSHFNSSRIGSLHASSSTPRKVRRSERKRRVATLAWWTLSGSVPRRTPGSLTSSRSVDVAIAACTTSAGVDAKSSGGGAVTSGGSAARGPSARTIFGTGSGEPAPAARSRATSAGSSVSGAPLRARPRARGIAPRGGCRRAPTPRRRRPRRSSCPARRAARRACAPC